MIKSTPKSLRAVAGFSLIEMMIALVAGLIVVGAVLAFTVSSVKANADFIQSTRLMQELRNASDFIVSDLKRAGYDEAAMDYVANPSVSDSSDFAPIRVDTTDANKHCIIYAYDRSPGDAGQIDPENGEVRAFRRATATFGTTSVGVIEVAESTATVSPDCDDSAGPDYDKYPTMCNTTTGWCALTDPRVIDITSFVIGTAAFGTSSHGIQNISAATGLNAMQLREFGITLAGELRSDGTITRTVQSNIKVRADCLRADISACAAAPTVVLPTPPVTPSP